VHGARTADDEETVIALLDDLNGLFAALEDGRDGVCGRGDLRCEELGLDERVLTEDWRGRGWLVLFEHCCREARVVAAYPSRRRRLR
jgi:hypothetical protein